MTNTPQIRVLKDGDQDALRAFLTPYFASSMFLISNVRRAGFQDQGRRYEGTYVAALEDTRIVAVAAHYWNRCVILQAPVYTIEVARAAVMASGRVIEALIGTIEQVERVQAAFAIAPGNLRFAEKEYLYTLDLGSLRIPDALRDGQLRVRPIEERDLALATDWRVAYGVELMHECDDAEYRRRCRAAMESSINEGTTWLLEDLLGRPLAQSGFNATLEDAVQVGGVWTPSHLRGRGYGRAVVAGSLQQVRARGVRLGILFTGVENRPAQKAYESIGFERVGDYCVMMLRDPIHIGSGNRR